MKKIFLIAITVVTAFGLKAQDIQGNSNDSKNKDTLKIKLNNGKKIWIFHDDKSITKTDSSNKGKKIIKKGNFFMVPGGFDVGFCALTTATNQFQVPTPDTYSTNDFLNLKYNRSLYFSLNLIKVNINLYKSHINFVTGMGIEWNSYNFISNITLNPDSNRTSAETIKINNDSNAKYIKNQLKASYIKIPLLLEFNTNTHDAHKSFHLAGGMEVGYKIDSWTKQKVEENGYTIKIKMHDDYNLNPFKYGIVVRAGYGWFTLFANYSLSPLFSINKGPEIAIYPFSTGITITF